MWLKPLTSDAGAINLCWPKKYCLLAQEESLDAVLVSIGCAELKR